MALHDDGSCPAGMTLLAVWRVRLLRQTGSDSGSTQHLPAMTLGKLQPDEAIGTRRQHSAEAQDAGFRAILVQSTACGHADERMGPSRPSHSGPARQDFQLGAQAADLSPNSLQHDTHFQGECAKSPSREGNGHETHECCQHESHQPDACPEPSIRSASAAESRGHTPEGQAPCSPDRPAMNDVLHTPGSSSSSAGSHVVVAEQGAPSRARSRSSMVLEVV